MNSCVYLEEEFLSVLDNYKPSQSILEIDYTTKHKDQLMNILNHSNLYIDKGNKYFINLFNQKSNSEFVPKSDFELIIIRALRNNMLFQSEVNYNSSGAIYLLNKSEKEANNISDLQNNICLSNEYSFKTKIINESFAAKEVNNKIEGEGFDLIKHKCKNIVLIDPYIFIDDKKLTPKMQNLIKLLKSLYYENYNASLNLSIITRHTQDNKLIESKIKILSEGLEKFNITLSVFAHPYKNLIGTNRHLITDYSLSDFAHVLDRDWGSISTDFFYDKDISKSFDRVQKIINELIKEYNKFKEKTFIDKKLNKNLSIKYNSILDNPLFQ